MTGWVGVIDSGGSKTRGAMASRAGEVVLTAEFAGSNPQDNDDWAPPLTGALAAMAPAELVLAGIAGFGEVAAVDAGVRAHFAAEPRVQLLNDVELAMHAGFPAGGGVLLVCGTGAMAMAEGPAGTVRAGGWGHVAGDEGSAYWIGRAGLSRASRELDGRAPDSGFGSGLLAALGLPPDAPFALLGWLQSEPHERSAVARVSRHVDALASAGNAPARQILDDAAGYLAELVSATGARAGLDADAPWQGTGSTLNSAVLSAALAARIGPPEARSRTPLAGALIYAATRAGWAPDADWARQVRGNLERQLLETGR